MVAFLSSKYSGPSENKISSFLIFNRKGKVFSSLCYKKVKHVMFDYPAAIFNTKCHPFAMNSMSPVLSLA